MSGLIRASAILGGALVSMLVALSGLRGPAPVAATAPASQFSAQRAIDCVRQIAAEEHPASTAAQARTRAWLTSRMGELGVEVEQQSWTSYVAAWNEPVPVERTFVNLLVRVAAREQPPALSILLVAHYDSRAGCPGASDDGLGVAVLLEVVRALHADGLERTALLVLLTDGEELGRLGAKHFVDTQLAAERLDVVINLDSLGNRAPLHLIEVGPGSDGLVHGFLDCAPQPAGSSVANEVLRAMPNSTDFTEFARAGRRGLGFACVGGAAVYHQATDTPERLDPRALQHAGDTVMGVLRELDQHGFEREASRSTFFTLLGTTVVRYPSSFDVAIAVGATLVGWLAWRRCRLSLQALGNGIATALLVSIFTAGVAWILWSIARQLRWGDESRVSEHRELVGMALCSLGAVAGLAHARVFRIAEPRAVVFGVGALWLGCGCGACWMAPGAAFAFVLPSLAIAVGLCATTNRAGRVANCTTLFAIFALLAPIALAMHGAGRAVPRLGAMISASVIASVVPIGWPSMIAERPSTLRSLTWMAALLGVGWLLAS